MKTRETWEAQKLPALSNYFSSTHLSLKFSGEPRMVSLEKNAKR
jgi:hypothetical protein